MTDGLTSLERHLLARLAKSFRRESVIRDSESLELVAIVLEQELDNDRQAMPPAPEPIEPEQPADTRARNRLIADIVDMREKIEAYESTAHHSLRPGLNFALGLIDDLLKRQARQ